MSGRILLKGHFVLTVGGVLIRHVELAQPEIAQCDMSSVVKQDVFGFQVTIEVSRQSHSLR
jgi:hypothetical protein